METQVMLNKIFYRISATYIMIFSAVAVIFLLGCNHTTDQEEKPNILFIAIDDLRPELGCYGADYIKSPNIDKLAEQGMVFNRAYCQVAICNPSRTSLLTGLYPDSSSVWRNNTRFRNTIPEAVTLPQYFKQNGYHSAAIGKIYHNIYPDTLSWSEPKLYVDGFPFDPDAVYAAEENLEYLENRKQEIREAGNEDRYIDRFGEWYLKSVSMESPDVPDSAYYDGAQTNMAIRKLAELKSMDQPFFFAIGFYKPHLPFNAPEKYWDMYDREALPIAQNTYLPEGAPRIAMNPNWEIKNYIDCRDLPRPWEQPVSDDRSRELKHGYAACVSYIDAQVGRLLKELDKLGLKKNTIVVLWGDHGWKLAEHNGWAKWTNYEIDTRVPLIISVPGEKNLGKTCNRLVEFVDVYPTLCELAGLEIPEKIQGKSFVPLLKNPDIEWEDAAYSQFYRSKRETTDEKDYMGYAIRTKHYRYIEWYTWENLEFVDRELYDHRSDPDENKNIASNPENKSIVDQLSIQLHNKEVFPSLIIQKQQL